MNSKAVNCPLCGTHNAADFFKGAHRLYHRCEECGLVFVNPVFLLSLKEEKSRYEQHRNSPDDQGYRNFLSRVFLPMKASLQPGSKGLDFGCGTGPTLSVMFEEAGYSMSVYDYFFAPDVSVFEKQYDFITATEVFEHLHHPENEVDRLWSCLKPGGLLGIMTKLVIDVKAFSTWHYKTDPTHVCFFSRPTFEWFARFKRADVSFVGSDVIILKKCAVT